jgi:hypothetical protein|tara:strand:- start:656 stop:844 length:189 start_codon:yes stop_codon:yes gene_type:complete
LTTIFLNGRVQWVSASCVIKTQRFIEAGKKPGEIAALIGRPKPYAQALVKTIMEHAQMGRAA